MSKKPKKHSEIKRDQKGNESTASRFKTSWRGKRVPVPLNPERHLIVSEGTVTEVKYFEEMKRRINSRFHGNPIAVEVKGAGMNTLSLLEYAKTLATEEPSGYTHVWVVYDKDSFSIDDFNSTALRCKTENAGGATYHAIWTNEAFELWYILHFDYMQSGIGRDRYAAMLTERLKSLGQAPYRKNDPDMFVKLEPFMDTGIRNAKKLEETNEGKSPSESCPGTRVHELVGHLKPFV